MFLSGTYSLSSLAYLILIYSLKRLSVLTTSRPSYCPNPYFSCINKSPILNGLKSIISFKLLLAVFESKISISLYLSLCITNISPLIAKGLTFGCFFT